jgi:hypothetical protein
MEDSDHISLVLLESTWVDLDHLQPMGSDYHNASLSKNLKEIKLIILSDWTPSHLDNGQSLQGTSTSTDLLVAWVSYRDKLP